MHNFKYFTPTEVVFGKDTEVKVGELIKKHGGSKVLVHYGSDNKTKDILLNKIYNSLKDNNIEYYILKGVVPNPRLSLVKEGIKLCKENNIDFILAIGGGSVIDSAKAIGYGVSNSGDVWDFYNHSRTPEACLSIGCILTLAAAGSEMSNSSVITNEETQEKRGCNTDYCRLKFAIMNPELTYTVSKYQTACGIVDILMHTEERYFTSGGNMKITDSIAEGLMKTVIKNAYILLDNPNDYNARAEIMWASSLSHNGLTGCGNDGGDFCCHALEHEISAIFDVSHAAGLSAIWASWARYVYKDNLPRFKKFAINVLGVNDNKSDEDIALEGIRLMEEFYLKLDMPICLDDLNINYQDSDLSKMAKSCAKANNGKKGSSKVLYESDMYQIYLDSRHKEKKLH